MNRIQYIFKLLRHIAVFLPVRASRIFQHIVRGIRLAFDWFLAPFKAIFRLNQDPFRVFRWSFGGFLQMVYWVNTLVLYILELIGLGECLMILWTLCFKMRPLHPVEMEASKLVHPNGLIPYELIRVDHHSLLSRLSRATICSMYVIHLEKDYISLPTMIHELTHAAQYVAVGAIYMPEAILAQQRFGRYGGHRSKSAYDYERTKTLEDQISAGDTFAQLNREAQAELIQDYFIKTINNKPISSAHAHFVSQMQNRLF